MKIQSATIILLLMMAITGIMSAQDDDSGVTSDRTLDWILIKGSEPKSIQNVGHYWIEILDKNGKPTESYGWFPQDTYLNTDFYLNLVKGVPGELNAQTRDSAEGRGTATHDPNEGKSADWEYHPVLTNTLTDQQALEKIRDFAHDYNGNWELFFRNCHTFQEDLMNNVGLVEPVAPDGTIIVPTKETKEHASTAKAGDKSDLGGINFTSINLNYIAVSTNGSGGINFDLILKAQKAKGDGPGIDLINSTSIGATAFMTGLAVPDNKFWVNLNPWEEDRIIDDQLRQSEVGRIMLEADLQMKRDFSNYGNPCTNETGKALHKLLDVRHDTLVQQCMKKFPGEVRDIDNIQFKPVTRHWIIPEKIYAYTNGTRIYLINATLAINSEPAANHSSFGVVNQDIRTLSKGCLEELNRSAKEYGEYFRELEDRMIHPYVVADVNCGAKYENLRNVYVALALAQWYKSRVSLHIDIFQDRLNSPNSTVLASQRSWNPNEIWNDYVYSFKNGEYKCWDNTTTKTAKGAYTESSYCSAGGVDFYGIKKHLVEINSLPPEVQDQVDKAIQDGIVDEEEYLLFGNRLHAYMKQDTPASISDSGISPKPPEPLGLKEEVHGHSSENKTDNSKALRNEKLSEEDDALSPVAKSTANATQITCPKGWSGPDKNGECWISIPLGSKGH